MKISAFLLLLAASISGNHDGSGGGVTAAAEALGLSDGEENVHKNENCETLNITAISIMFQVVTPVDVDTSLCNEMYTVTPRCAGSTDIVSSPVVVDLGTGRNTTSQNLFGSDMARLCFRILVVCMSNPIKSVRTI